MFGKESISAYILYILYILHTHTHTHARACTHARTRARVCTIIYIIHITIYILHIPLYILYILPYIYILHIPLYIYRAPRGSVVRCLTRNPGLLGSSRTRSSGSFRGSVLGQDTSEPSLVLVKPRKA